MNPIPTLARRALIAALAVALVSSAGCSWFRGKSGYENSPESRPLELPPDLDAPASDGSMQIPQIPAAAATPRATPARPAAGASFLIADSAESAWRRLGLALDRIEGVTISERAQAESAYAVAYDGESFQLKVTAQGEGSRVSAVGADGQEVRTGAAGKLLALLKQRLG